MSTFPKNGNGGETLEFHHPDRLGIKLVTNNTANTSFEQSTLPFGTALDAETTGATNQRFTSHDRSTVASLDYAVNRSYSSGQGRFTSVDPIGMGATSLGSPQSLNLYAYVQNNPIDFVDPFGLTYFSLPEEQECHYEARYYKTSVEIKDDPSPVAIEWTGGNGSSEGVDYVLVCESKNKPQIISDPGIPSKPTIDTILDHKREGRTNTCREFLDKVINVLKPGATVNSVYGDIGKFNLNKNFVTKPGQKRTKKGLAYFENGKRIIDVGPFEGNSSLQHLSDFYFAKTIIHELLHHAAKPGKMNDGHHKIALAMANVLGITLPSGNDEDDSDFINEQIRLHCEPVQQANNSN